MKKIIRNSEIIKATRKFTDREEPRKVFWDKYKILKENFKNAEDIYLLTYYGVGGIGKSSLLRKLIDELKEKEEKPYYLLFDFEIAQDMKTVLSMIKNKLENDYKFDFPMFDLAIYTYAKKIGENAEKPEVKSIVEKSRTLSFILDGLGEFSIAGMAAKILKLLDSGIAVIRNANAKSDLIDLENEPADETYKKLAYYFSQDLLSNVQNLDKPLIIFLDTYEKLVNEVKQDGYTLMKDLWLRDDNGPILQVPGILWVIAGREKIKWGDYDKDWEETLEQHLLGDLSFEDADDFLKEAGISEEKLRNQIYKLTNGTPVYLDICVSTYEILQANGEKISIDKFGTKVDKLVERYIKYMDTQSSEMVYILSLIGNWDDQMLQEVIYDILPNFSITLYEKIKKLSFVLYENEKYYIHKTVRDIFIKDCPKILKVKTLDVLGNYYTEFLDNSSILGENYIRYIYSFIELLLNNVEQDTIDVFLDICEVYFNFLQVACAYDTINDLVVKIYDRLDFKYHDSPKFHNIIFRYNKLTEKESEEINLQKLNVDKANDLIENNDLNLSALGTIYSYYEQTAEYNEYEILKITKFMRENNVDKTNFDKSDINGLTDYTYNMFLYSFLLGSFYSLLDGEDNKESALEMFNFAKIFAEKLYEVTNIVKTYGKNELLSILYKILKLYLQCPELAKNGEDKEIVDKTEKMVSEMDIENEEEKSFLEVLLYQIYDTLALYYLDRNLNLDKASMWIKKQKEQFKIIGENNLTIYKRVILNEFRCLYKRGDTEAVSNFLKDIVEKLKLQNFDWEESNFLLLDIFKVIERPKEKILDNFYEANSKLSLESLYRVIEYIESTEKKYLDKFANIIFDRIAKTGINEDNVSVLENTCFYMYRRINFDEVEDLIDEKLENCMNFYEDKYGNESEELIRFSFRVLSAKEKYEINDED